MSQDYNEREYEEFEDNLIKATAEIRDYYFLFKVAYEEDPIFRERVYCYELYHRLRNLMGDPPQGEVRGSPYVLNGEVDKASHKSFPQEWEPDLLYHVPGNNDNNLVIIEVKAFTESGGPPDGKADFRKFSYFLAKEIEEVPEKYREYAAEHGLPRYSRAVWLVYGGSGGAEEALKRKVRTGIKTFANEDMKRRLTVLWHLEVGCKPRFLFKNGGLKNGSY